MKKKKRNISFKRVVLFIIQVALPVVAVPILPSLIKGCTEAGAFIIGLGFSIFLAIWEFILDSSEANNEAVEDRNVKSEKIDKLIHHFDKSFENLEDHVYLLETFLDFYQQINRIRSPYFRRKINAEFMRMVEEFKTQNEVLLSGYVETHPYCVDTYGVDGIRFTKHKLLAVSSINDYWDRENFANDYLLTQYNLIENQSISITRIFIGEKEHLKSLVELMKDQDKHGINVYYMETDSMFFSDEWKNQDFLIQDDMLIVDLKTESHRAESEAKEIISTRKEDVENKIILFNQMLHNAKRYVVE